MIVRPGGKYKIRAGNKAKCYGHGWEPGRGDCAHVAVKLNAGWVFGVYEFNGRYSQDDSRSDWDIVEEVEAPEDDEPDKEAPLTLVPAAFSADGRPVYMYVSEDIHRNRLAQALRVSSDPAYGNGYRRLDAMSQEDLDKFDFTIKNPPQ